MRQLSTTIKAWPLLLCLLAINLSGCRTQEKAVRTEFRYIHTHDIVRVEKWDTVRIEIKGDTVYVLEKLHEVEHYSTIYRDTLRTSDTLRIERVTSQPMQAEKRVKWWRWFSFGFLSALFLFLLIFAAKIIIKLYLRK